MDFAIDNFRIKYAYWVNENTFDQNSFSAYTLTLLKQCDLFLLTMLASGNYEMTIEE